MELNGFYEHVYSPKADNKNRYDRYVQGEEKIMIKHSEKKTTNDRHHFIGRQKN